MFRMLKVFLAIVLAAHGCAGRAIPTKSDHWAVLIAGSFGWWNYRHQSDVLHAYQVLINKGVKPENIIVMVYDDIANAKYNPFPGKIFNRPNGIDVYEGVPLDYTGMDVSVDVFLGVLSGNSSAVKKKGSGKVVKSMRGDKVFVYYSDHGASGLICMPIGDDLYADQLHKVLKTHYHDGFKGELVFYLEACESGSMFDGFTTGLDLFATTAANPYESSWAYYCPGDSAASEYGPNDPTPDTIGACLGDEYSIHWLEDAEASDLTVETLKEQYKRVKKLTLESHVMHYGQYEIEVEDASNFIGITDLEPPTTEGGPEDVRDEDEDEDDNDKDDDDDDEATRTMQQNSHRRMLKEDDEEEEHDNEDEHELVVDRDHESESESEESEKGEDDKDEKEKSEKGEDDKDEEEKSEKGEDDKDEEEKSEKGEDDKDEEEEKEEEEDTEGHDHGDEYEQGAAHTAANRPQRVPQRDAELAGMYATLKRADLTPELRREVEDELLKTIETRRQVDEHARRSAQRLLLGSNGRLMSFLSEHMAEEEMEEDTEASDDVQLAMVQDSGRSMRLQAFTRQVLYAANGRPAAGKPLVDDWDCLREMVAAWKAATNLWDNAAKRHTRYFANLCNAGVPPQDFALALKHQARSSTAASDAAAVA